MNSVLDFSILILKETQSMSTVHFHRHPSNLYASICFQSQIKFKSGWVIDPASSMGILKASYSTVFQSHPSNLCRQFVFQGHCFRAKSKSIIHTFFMHLSRVSKARKCSQTVLYTIYILNVIGPYNAVIFFFAISWLLVHSQSPCT